MNKIYLGLFLFFIGYSATCQVAVLNKDSLLQLLTHANEDTGKVLLLIKIGNEYERSLPDSAVYYYQASGELSKRIHYNVGVLKYISNYTAVLNLRDKYDESLVLNKQAIQLATEIHNNLQLAVAYGNAGASYYGLKDYATCIDCFLHAEAILNKIGDSTRLVLTYGNLTGLYNEVNQYGKSYEYGLKAIQLSRALNDEYALEEALENTGNTLSYLKKMDSAILLLNQTIVIANKIDDKLEIINSSINLADIYYDQHRFEEMNAFAEKALTASKALGNNEGEGKALVFKGRFCFLNRNYSAANNYAAMALQIGLKNKVLEVIRNAYLLLDDIALANGDLNNFYSYRKLKDSVQNIIVSQQIIKNTQDIEGRYSLEKKESQIKDLNQEKQIQLLTIHQSRTTIGILVASLFAIAVAAFFIFRNAQQRRKLLQAQTIIKEQRITELENEKQLMAADAVLKGQEEERLRLAKDLHDGLGGILTGTKYSLGNMKQNMIISAENAALFEKTMNMLDKSINELRRVTHNMMPENLLNINLDEALGDYCLQVTQSGALEVKYQSYDMADAVITDTVKMNVYRIVQELINNTAKHAEASRAIVQLTCKDNVLGITVEDNGKGMDVSALADAEGIGYKNIRSRVEYLRGHIDIQSVKSKGSSILIKIPV
jgi:signal transduction histidine kinase